MAMRKIAHPSIDDREAKGLEARGNAALPSHARWRPAADRLDPVTLLEQQDAGREPDLVPVRHGRMMASPFAYYRGAATVMAVDLKDTPVAGLRPSSAETRICRTSACSPPTRTSETTASSSRRSAPVG